MTLVALLIQSRAADGQQAESAFAQLYAALRMPLEDELRGFARQLDAFTRDALANDAIFRSLFGRSGASIPTGARFEPTKDARDAQLVRYVCTTARRLAIDTLRSRGETVALDWDVGVTIDPWGDARAAKSGSQVARRLKVLHDEFLERLQQLHHRHEQITLFAWSEWRQLKREVTWSQFVRDNPLHFPAAYGSELPDREAVRIADLLRSVFDLTVDVIPLQGALELPDAAVARADRAKAALLGAGAPETKDLSRRPGRPKLGQSRDGALITVQTLSPRVTSCAGLRVEVRDGAGAQSNANAAQHYKNSGGRLLLGLHLLRHHLDRQLVATNAPCAGQFLRVALHRAQQSRVDRLASTSLDTELLLGILDASEHLLEPDWVQLSRSLRVPAMEELGCDPLRLASVLVDSRVRVEVVGPGRSAVALRSAVSGALAGANVRKPDAVLRRLVCIDDERQPQSMRWLRPPPVDPDALLARARDHLAELILSVLYVLLRGRPASYAARSPLESVDVVIGGALS